LIVEIQEEYTQIASKGLSPITKITRRILEAHPTENTERCTSIQRLFNKFLKEIKSLYPKDFETKEVQSIGLEFWKSANCHNLEVILDVFEIRSLINTQEIIPKIEAWIKEKNSFVSAKYIVALNLQEKFELVPIIKSIVGDRHSLRESVLFRLIGGNVELQKVALEEALSLKKTDLAKELIQQFGLSLDEYPELKVLLALKVKTKPERVEVDLTTKQEKQADKRANKLLKFYKKSNWMQNEEKMFDEIGHLKKYVCSLLSAKETEDIALSIIQRNKILLKKLPEVELEKVGPYFSTPPTLTFNYIENSIFTCDGHGPSEEILGISLPDTYLHLSDLGYSEDNAIIYIDEVKSQAFELALKDILCSKKIGLDNEFKWSNRDRNKVDLVQIATENKIYLFDTSYEEFARSPKYKNFLRSLLTHPELSIIGHTISGDLGQLSHALGYQFKRTVGSIDICRLFKKIFRKEKFSLQAICEKVLKKPYSKFEQISNWTKRPLRKTQMYYAAMDAAVVLKVHEKLEEIIENPELYKLYQEEQRIQDENQSNQDDIQNHQDQVENRIENNHSNIEESKE